jgi:hypothetical protein
MLRTVQPSLSSLDTTIIRVQRLARCPYTIAGGDGSFVEINSSEIWSTFNL